MFHASHIEVRNSRSRSFEVHKPGVFIVNLLYLYLLQTTYMCSCSVAKRLFVVGMFTVYTGERTKCRHAYRNRKKTSKFYSAAIDVVVALVFFFVHLSTAAAAFLLFFFLLAMSVCQLTHLFGV